MKKILLLLSFTIYSNAIEIEAGCSGYGFKDFVMPTKPDICGATNEITNFLGDKLSFSIGGCSIGLEADQSSFMNDINEACKAATEGLEDLENRIISPMDAMITSSTQYSFIKGAKGEDCGDGSNFGEVENPSGMTNDEIYEATDIKTMASKNGLFSSATDDLRDCMKMSGEEKCNEDGFIKLPETSLDTEKEIAKASNYVSQADESVAPNISSVETELYAKKAECDKKEYAQAVECREKLQYGNDSLDSQAKKKITKIEMVTASNFSLLQKASRGDTYYVFKDSDSMDRLPKAVAEKYSDGVARQNAADTLIAGFYKENTNLKKNNITLIYGKAQIMSEPYNPKASVTDLKDYLLKSQKSEDGESEGESDE